MKDAAPHPTVLLCGGGPRECAAMTAALAEGYDCIAASDPGRALEVMADHFVQVVVWSGAAAESGWDEVFARIGTHWPETLGVLVTDDAPEADADRLPNVEHVLTRPWTASELRIAVSAACQAFALRRENERLALEMRLRAPGRDHKFPPSAASGFEAVLCTPGSAMAAAVASARQFASFDVPVLLTGEAGTGKADMARAIHMSSLRSDRPYQAFDCTGLSDRAISAALFGAPRPDGTVRAPRAGLVRRADHGSLYISGIEGLSPEMQLRLLRLARDGTYEEPGAAEMQSSGARLIFGAGVDLRQRVEQGAMRADLYFTIAVAELQLPPLRDRAADFPLIARSLAEEAGRDHRKPVQGLSEAALSFLAAYGWPGNLRELENELTRMVIHAQGPVLGPDLISRHILQAAPAVESSPQEQDVMVGDRPLKERIEAIEARILRETLTRLKWNKSRSAAELGVSRVGLRAKLDRYGITPPQPATQEA
ncbi:MAG: sigma 54-interacting transcriptional regulator [Paracoccaceae bacterium]|nr:sigma 54-interacting transcriptional regulator [Paracoccaceae bacterium]